MIWGEKPTAYALFSGSLMAHSLMTPLFLALLALIGEVWLGAETLHGQLPKPLPQAHAHNDYLHQRPLLDALDAGFCSVEADIFLVDGELLVAHSRDELSTERSLRRLYLEPLKERVEHNRGSVFGDKQSFTLLIDIKADGEATYLALDALLAEYSDIFASVETTASGQVIEHDGPVTAIVSGDRPVQAITADAHRFVGIDGRLGDLASDKPSHLLPLISDNWGLHFAWRGVGKISVEDAQKLRDVVQQVHAKKRKLRFWAIPDTQAAWALLEEAGVDMINTDKLQELSQYLRR